MIKDIKISEVSSFSSVVESLDDVRNFINQNLDKIGMSDDVKYNIILAVEEACTNVIKYAYNPEEKGIITIKIEFNKTLLRISIIDKGKGFDPKLLPKPDIKEYYKSHKVGGWGIYLMQSLMDEVTFSFNPGKENIVHLLKYLK